MPEWTGDWRVEVRDSRGNVLETIRFTVGPNRQPVGSSPHFWDTTARPGDVGRGVGFNCRTSLPQFRSPERPKVPLVGVSSRVPTSDPFVSSLKMVGNH